MRYTILLGISQEGEAETMAQAINVASETSYAHPVRLVRIIDTHTDAIAFTYRAGAPCVGDWK